MAQKEILLPFQLIPEYRDYVWGGSRLRPGISPTAEAWVVYEKDRIASGPHIGKTLAELALEYPDQLLGTRALERTASRFPLLIKILDCAQWLSLQVHPNDQQAEMLEGPGYFGKTEAWHVIEANPDGRIIAGIRPGVGSETIETAIRQGSILDYAQELKVQTGMTIFMPPGTLHALGPGLMIYEVQQSSDLTYRVYDWGRPQSPERRLHIDKSIAVVNPNYQPQAVPQPGLQDGESQVLCQNAYFTLEMLVSEKLSIHKDTRFQSFHALTVISGSAKVSTPQVSLALGCFETALIPASCGEYQIAACDEPFKILNSYVE